MTADLRNSRPRHRLTSDDAERKALAWLEKASRPVSAFENDAVVCDVLDALAVNLDGAQAAAEYFSRRRRVLHRVLGYAVRKQRLEKNPVSKGNLPESWTPPQAPDDAIDPRCVGSPALITEMLAACSYVGRGQGPRFVAFYGCMYYAMMRPAEVAALTRDGCQRAQRPHQGQAAQRTAGTQARAPGPRAAGDGHPAARPSRAVRHRR